MIRPLLISPVSACTLPSAHQGSAALSSLFLQKVRLIPPFRLHISGSFSPGCPFQDGLFSFSGRSILWRLPTSLVLCLSMASHLHSTLGPHCILDPRSFPSKLRIIPLLWCTVHFNQLVSPVRSPSKTHLSPFLFLQLYHLYLPTGCQLPSPWLWQCHPK